MKYVLEYNYSFDRGVGQHQTDNNGRRWWRATSCIEWTTPRWSEVSENTCPANLTLEGEGHQIFNLILFQLVFPQAHVCTYMFILFSHIRPHKSSREMGTNEGIPWNASFEANHIRQESTCKICVCLRWCSTMWMYTICIHVYPCVPFMANSPSVHKIFEKCLIAVWAIDISWHTLCEHPFSLSQWTCLSLPQLLFCKSPSLNCSVCFGASDIFTKCVSAYCHMHVFVYGACLQA